MNSRVSLTLGHDLVMAAMSFYIALYLRLGPGLFDLSQQIVGLGLIAFIACAAVVFVVFGLPRMVWRYCAMDDMMRIGQAVIVTLLLFVAVQFVITRLDDFPRSFLIIDLFVLTALLALPRLAFRAIKDGRLSHLWERGGGNRALVLLIGAGNGSALFLRELAQGSDAPYRVVGIIETKANTPASASRASTCWVIGTKWRRCLTAWRHEAPRHSAWS